MESFPRILIVENGGQLTLKIQTILRELGYRSAVLDPGKSETYLSKHPVDLVIFSGGDGSVYDERALRLPANAFSNRRALLGICYGHQGMAHQLGGFVEKQAGQFSSAGRVRVDTDSLLFADMPSMQDVTLSHGDSVLRVPVGFRSTACRPDGTGIMAMEHERHRWFSVQWHPEAEQSVYGRQLFVNLTELAGCKKDWQPQSLAQSRTDRIRSEVGSKKTLLGFSGGVDSTTVAMLGSVLGDQLLAVTLDCGQFREGELVEICRHAEATRVRHEIVDVRHLFEKAFLNTTDAEAERKIFQSLYRAALEEYGLAHGTSLMIQGTLAPDRIESAKTGGAKIKTHHNVGIQWKYHTGLDPIEDLFKYEVRDLAREIGLPISVWKRHPFPGPGLFLRVVGATITPARTATVRFADHTASSIVKRHDLYDEMSQMPVGVFFGDKVTGVKGDARAYAHMAVVRPVITSDFMTLKGYYLPRDVEEEISFEVAKHPELLGAMFDYNPKPPRTTEFK